MSRPSRSSLHLPARYGRHLTINLKKDRRFTLGVQAIALVAVLAAVSLVLVLDLPLDSGWSR